jgi:hypothetical protein
MKKIIILVGLLLTFNSCTIYQEPTSLSLSGEYIIDKVTVISTENTTNNSGQIYSIGTHYVNNLDTFPLDDIYVGFTRWHFDYSILSFYPISMGDGTTNWQRKYFYSVVNHESIYDLGYIKFQVNGSVRIFKILDDGMESLTLQNTGLWPYSNSGPNEVVMLHLTRIGP